MGDLQLTRTHEIVEQLRTPGGDIRVSQDPTIAAHQLAVERDRINANAYLTPAAKRFRIRYIERSFAGAQYGQTLGWPARIAWAIATIPLDIAWSLYNFPDILQYGLLGGLGGSGGGGGADGRGLQGGQDNSDQSAIEDDPEEPGPRRL